MLRGLQKQKLAPIQNRQLMNDLMQNLHEEMTAFFRARKLTRTFLLMASIFVGLQFAQIGECLAEVLQFNQQIRPILSEYCFQCHGPDANKRQGDLRLDLEQNAKEHAIIGASESELFLRITSDDEKERMPPPETGKRLSAKEIDLIRQWLEQGAPYQGHWAFEPITKPKIQAYSSSGTTHE